MITLDQIDKTSLKCHRFRIYLEVEKFYKDPENMKRFEKWKAARETKDAEPQLMEN